jgi:hypothetical protein
LNVALKTHAGRRESYLGACFVHASAKNLALAADHGQLDEFRTIVIGRRISDVESAPSKSRSVSNAVTNPSRVGCGPARRSPSTNTLAAM